MKIHILVCSMLCLYLIAPAHSATAWVEQASVPGPDIPPVGASRFDQLFLKGQHYRIPYPFEALLDDLEARVDNGREKGLRHALIPIGRSLAHEAVAPDYFRFPRSVIALQGEPVDGIDEAGLVLEYRIFIAHQPKTGIIEVISYNDEFGRFEFQLIENYSAGGQPRLRQVRRILCLSCHQNAGPLFPARPWSETNFNTAVATRLIEAQPHKYSSLIGLVTQDAGILDVIAERANYLSASQTIWQLGCDTPTCRAAMLRAILQYRLSGKASFDAQDEAYRLDYRQRLRRNWRRLWPQGLKLASSRIPDLDPLTALPPERRLDPLSPRPAQAHWREADDTLAEGIIYRLAGFLTQADILRIDRQLQRLADTQGAAVREWRVSCRKSASGAYSLLLSCGDFSLRQGLQARLEIETDESGEATPGFLHLKLPHDPNIWQPQAVNIKRDNGGMDFEFRDPVSGLSQRMQQGHRIAGARLSWQGEQNEATLRLRLVQDFVFIDKALAAMLTDDAGRASQVLATAPFRRRAVISDLTRHLGMAALIWPPIPRVPPATASDPPVADLDGNLALLNAYCAHCHNLPGPDPPGFLHGHMVQAQLIQCAPRMLARLRAWQSGSVFTRSPMPPPASLGYSGSSADAWPDSDHYRLLLADIETLAQKHYSPAELDRWRVAGVASSVPCLARD